MRVDDLDYKLPEALIAQEPLAERSAARMLVLNRGVLEHRRVRELPALLEPSLFVVNQTRVLAARLRGQKSTGGRAELLLVEPVDGQKLLWRTLGTANKPLKAGQVLHFDDVVARIEAREEGMLRVRFEGNFASRSFESFVAAAGEMPLPPYIARRATAADAERYQTIFASELGAVAAPTAGLHFDDALVAALDDAGHRFTAVTLHVGPGTFRPVQVEDLDAHPMHEERYEVPPEAADAIDQARREGRRVVAVGTTVVRTLEGAALAGGGVLTARKGRTDLFIRPGFRPRVVDDLLTNFHLPRSTLLALVMAFAGEGTTRAAYAEAVAERYRFFSYGDAMFIRHIERAT